MIDPTWKRIAGLHVEDDGVIGAVWMALDWISNVVHVYDAAKLDNEVPAVIVEAIAARGRHYPLAWRKQDKEFADLLLEGGVNVLPDHCTDNQAMIEVVSREIQQKMRTGQFRVDKRVGSWILEYNNFTKDGSHVPKEGFPLMAATRHCIEMLSWAEPERQPGRDMPNHPKVRIV